MDAKKTLRLIVPQKIFCELLFIFLAIAFHLKPSISCVITWHIGGHSEHSGFIPVAPKFLHFVKMFKNIYDMPDWFKVTEEPEKDLHQTLQRGIFQFKIDWNL